METRNERTTMEDNLKVTPPRSQLPKPWVGGAVSSESFRQSQEVGVDEQGSGGGRVGGGRFTSQRSTPSNDVVVFGLGWGGGWVWGTFGIAFKM